MSRVVSLLFTAVNMIVTLKNNHVDHVRDTQALIFHIKKIIGDIRGWDVSDQNVWDTGLTKTLMFKF